MVAYDKDFYLIVHSTFEKKEEEKE